MELFDFTFFFSFILENNGKNAVNDCKARVSGAVIRPTASQLSGGGFNSRYAFM
jgi:hypothetical protein